MTTVSVLVGNPVPRSRTYALALSVAEALSTALGQYGVTTAPGLVVDAAELATDVLGAHGTRRLRPVLGELAGSDLLVVASPTYKASYTGLLKAVLDHAAPGEFAGVLAAPVMVAGTDRHALVVERDLRPLLVELGATVTRAGLFVREQDLGSAAEPDSVRRWADSVGEQVARHVGRPAAATWVAS
jgi:FMN reductase